MTGLTQARAEPQSESSCIAYQEMVSHTMSLARRPSQVRSWALNPQPRPAAAVMWAAIWITWVTSLHHLRACTREVEDTGSSGQRGRKPSPLLHLFLVESRLGFQLRQEFHSSLGKRGQAASTAGEAGTLGLKCHCVRTIQHYKSHRSSCWAQISSIISSEITAWCTEALAVQ